MATYFAALGVQSVRRAPREIMECASEDIANWLDAYWLGDGSHSGNGHEAAGTKPTKVLFTMHEGLADDLQEAGMKAGYRAQKMWHRMQPTPFGDAGEPSRVGRVASRKTYGEEALAGNVKRR